MLASNSERFKATIGKDMKLARAFEQMFPELTTCYTLALLAASINSRFLINQKRNLHSLVCHSHENITLTRKKVSQAEEWSLIPAKYLLGRNQSSWFDKGDGKEKRLTTRKKASTVIPI